VIGPSFLPLKSIQSKDSSAVHQVPFVPSQVVDCIWDEGRFGNMDGLKKRLLPKAAAAKEGRCTIDGTECENTFNGARYDPECQRMGMVLIPGLNVKC
jgi:hypothetical protein